MRRKREERATLEEQMREFFVHGGSITEVRQGMSGRCEGEAIPRFTLTDKQLREDDRTSVIRNSMAESRKRGTLAANRSKRR